MENFIAYNPTELLFGKDVINELSDTVTLYGKQVLLMYGKGSIKKNGVYDKVMEQLQKAGAEVHEFKGIKPNPLAQDVDSAAELGIENKVDVIVAVGGGSVIDSAKIASLCIPGKHKAWDIMTNKAVADEAVPLIAVLTLAATGTEMNGNAVIQNHETEEKLGYHDDSATRVTHFSTPYSPIRYHQPKPQTVW